MTSSVAVVTSSYLHSNNLLFHSNISPPDFERLPNSRTRK